MGFMLYVLLIGNTSMDMHTERYATLAQCERAKATVDYMMRVAQYNHAPIRGAIVSCQQIEE